MVGKIEDKRVLYIDIETVSGVGEYADLSPVMQELWNKKAKQVTRNLPEEEYTPEKFAEIFKDKAGIFAEFGKIVCISVGFVKNDTEGNTSVHLKSYYGEDEHLLLVDFCKLFYKPDGKPKHYQLCGHNINEFDVPYICRRLAILQIPFPELFQIAGKKPWEIKDTFLDTMVFWKFGDYKNYTALKLLCGIFEIPSPKDDIDGSQVGRVFWEENDVERIAKYCEKDVLATAQLFRRFQQKPLISEDKVHFSIE